MSQFPQDLRMHPIKALTPTTLTWSSSAQSLFSTFSLACSQTFLSAALAIKTEAKRELSLLRLLWMLCQNQQQTHVFPNLLLLVYWREPFLLSLTSLARFNSKWTLAFQIAFLHTLKTFLYPSQVPKNPAPFSTSFHELPSSLYVLPEAPCSSMQVSCPFAWFLTCKDSLTLLLEEVILIQLFSYGTVKY